MKYFVKAAAADTLILIGVTAVLLTLSNHWVWFFNWLKSF
jgi:hypothetical protein